MPDTETPPAQLKEWFNDARYRRLLVIFRPLTRGLIGSGF
jgi:hypothetical protein